MPNIEVEVKSFIDQDKYFDLVTWFRDNTELLKDDYQETYYFNCEDDLRIQRNKFGAKVVLKVGDYHDKIREETEIPFDRENFEDMEKILCTLGNGVEIKWFRERQKFDWDGINVCLDYTKGYGYIIELEKLCSLDEKEEVLEMLMNKMDQLGVKITPLEEFEAAFEKYKKNWREIVDKMD